MQEPHSFNPSGRDHYIATVLATCFGIFGHSLAFVAGIFLFSPLYVVLSIFFSVLTGIVYVVSFYPHFTNWRITVIGGLLAGALSNIFWFVQSVSVVWPMYLLNVALSLFGSLTARLYFRKGVSMPSH